MYHAYRLENPGRAGQAASTERCLLPANFCLNAPDPDADDSTVSRTGAIHRRGINQPQPHLHQERSPPQDVEAATACLLTEEEQVLHPLPQPVIDDSNQRQDVEISDQRDAEGLVQVTIITPEELKALEIMIPEEDGSQNSRFGLTESESLIPSGATPVCLSDSDSAAALKAGVACLHAHDVNEVVSSTEEMPLDRFTSVDPLLLDKNHEEIKDQEKGPPISENPQQKQLVEETHSLGLQAPHQSNELVDAGSPDETKSLQDDQNGNADPGSVESTQKVEQTDRETISASSPVLSSEDKTLHVDDRRNGEANEQVDVLDSESQQASLNGGSNAIRSDGSILPNQSGENPDTGSREDTVLQTLDDSQEEMLARDMKYLQHLLEAIPDAITLIQRIKMNNLCNESNATPWQRKGDPPAHHISITSFEASREREAENPNLDNNSGQQKSPATTKFDTSGLHRKFPFQSVPRQMKDPPCHTWDVTPLNNKVDPPTSDSATSDTETNSVWRATLGESRVPNSVATLAHAFQKEDPPCERWKDKEDPPQQAPSATPVASGHSPNVAKEDDSDGGPRQDDFEEERQSTDVTRVDEPNDLVPGAVRAYIRHLVDDEDVPAFLPASIRRQAREARAAMNYVPEQQNLKKEDEYGDHSKSLNDYEGKGSIHSYVSNQPVAGAVHVGGIGQGSIVSDSEADNLLDSSVTESFATDETSQRGHSVVAEVVNTEDLFGELLNFMQRSLPQAEVVQDHSHSQTNKVDSQTDEVGSDSETSKKRKPWLRRWFGRNRNQQNSSQG